jgi:hypothetical protein
MKIWTKDELRKAIKNDENKILNTQTGDLTNGWSISDQDYSEIYHLIVNCLEDNIEDLHPKATKIKYSIIWHDQPWGKEWRIDWGKDISVIDENNNDLKVSEADIYKLFDKCEEKIKDETIDEWINEDEIEISGYDFGEIWEMLSDSLKIEEK